MFTGIIETTGEVISIEKAGTNLCFTIKSEISNSLKPDQSVAHNGVCLTVEWVKNGMHKITAILETLNKTNLNNWRPGTLVNLERCLPMNGRLDGHIVQGHIDETATCQHIEPKNGSYELQFRLNNPDAGLIIEKGSICINGVSLTCFGVSNNSFWVAIIPYTFQHTNFLQLKKLDLVNIEFDIIGKYISRMLELRSGKNE